MGEFSKVIRVQGLGDIFCSGYVQTMRKCQVLSARLGVLVTSQVIASRQTIVLRAWSLLKMTGFGGIMMSQDTTHRRWIVLWSYDGCEVCQGGWGLRYKLVSHLPTPESGDGYD